MDIIIKQTMFLLGFAIIVALIAHRYKLPYTVGLVVAGILLSLTHVHMDLNLTHTLISNVILPPLLFEAAININAKELRRDIFPILILALLGVIVSASVITAGMVYGLGWSLASALLFGVLIAATYPVAVIAMFKDLKIEGRLRLLVEGESLLNDGGAAVLFVIVLTFATGSVPITPLWVVKTLLINVGGGMATGLILGGAALIVAGHSQDHLVETTLTTLVAFGSFMTAEHLHCSGVLAVVTAGLILGNPSIIRKDGGKCLSEKGHSFIVDFWEFIAFLANSFIFLLIGLRVAAISFGIIGIASITVIILLVLFSRAVAVYPLCLPFIRSPLKIPFAYQHILWWGGLRGALGLALCLSLPDTVPFHNEIVIATFAVVAFSVIVQGITMPALIKKLKL